MTGVSFSKAPATSAAPTAGRRGSVTPSIDGVAVEVDLAQPAGHRHVAPQASVERGEQLGGPGAEGPAHPAGLEVSGRPRVEGGSDVGVGALDRADDRAAARGCARPGGRSRR